MYREQNEALSKSQEQLQQEIETQKEAIQENQKTADFWANFLMDQQTQATSAADSFKQQAFELAEKDLNLYLEDIEKKKKEALDDYFEEYNRTLEEAVSSFLLQIVDKQDELYDLKIKIDDARSNMANIVEERKRQAEMEDNKNFYRLVLSDEDIEEIKKLRSILPYLRDKEPLNKVIYKVYYEKPYTDLVGRVVGTGVHTGIYKITNLENQMCYIGQAANIAERWRQHIKRGVGADPPTRNKLYPAMLSTGVENFTFEIIEECSREKLNEQEDYWQDFYKAKEFGYSIK